MKEIEINGKKYKLHIGLDFIRELDRKYPHKYGDVAFGMGVQKIFLLLCQTNPVAMADFILAATNTLDSQPALHEIEAQMEVWGADGINDICESFVDALMTSSLTKAPIAQMGLLGQVLEVKAALEAKAAQDGEILPAEPIGI